MAENRSILLSWTVFCPVSEGQDPLGLNLRVSARLASQLFYCITSITPRARYYSFLPWAIGKALEMGDERPLRERIKNIEKAFVAANIINHSGNPCEDGRLMGSDLISNWYQNKPLESVDIEKLPFAKIPAIDAYLASLVNLRLFQTDEEFSEQNSENDTQVTSTQGLKLSSLGKKVVQKYQDSIASADPTKDLNNGRFIVEADKLAEWGRVGGLCELKHGGEDLQILTDLFFNKVDLESRSHNWRRNTLLLLLFLGKVFPEYGVVINLHDFGEAVYFDHIIDADGISRELQWPAALKDIVLRWRMFYFHFYLSAAMENIFVSIVSEGNLKGLQGFTLLEFLSSFEKPGFNRDLRILLDVEIKKPFAELTMRELFSAYGLDICRFDVEGSNAIEEFVRIKHPLSEGRIQRHLRKKEIHGTREAVGLSAVLCCQVCLRYLKWENDSCGQWLAQSVMDDPYQNVTVPVVVREFRRHFSDVLNTPLINILRYLINRFIIHLHISLAFQKSGSFFYLDDDRIRGRGKRYEKPEYGNGRFPSAVLILKDLGLLKHDQNNEKILKCTEKGKNLFKDILNKGPLV